MANLLLVVDPDPGRREGVVRAAQERMAPVAGLAHGRLDGSGATLVWCAAPSAPREVARAPEGMAVCLGLAVDGERGSVALEDVARGVAPVGPRDGIHLLARLDGRGGAELSVDVLGLVPLYRAEPGDGVVLAGTSPRLFPLHPRFRVRLHPAGLVGPLLVHFPFDACTAWEGVRRVEPGCSLVVEPSGAVHERRLWSLPPEGPAEDWSLDEVADRLHVAQEAALLRQLEPGRSVGILLSGGRDSRELAGSLAAAGVEAEALTLGKPGDDEVVCAAAVARVTGMRHRVAEVPAERVPDGVRLQARWEHVASGFGSAHMWGVLPLLADLPDRVVMGHLRGIREVRRKPPAFAAYLAGQAERGIPPGELPRWLREEGAEEMVRARVEAMRAAYEATATDPDERRWRFQLRVRMRHHAGAVPWRLAFGRWPVLPFADRAFLETLARAPYDLVAGRVAQDRALERHHPELAVLPLDRNDGTRDPVSLRPGTRFLRRTLARRSRKWGRRVARAVGLAPPERRRYYRIYDFDGPAWQAVREAAEPHRRRLDVLLRPEAVATVWPPAGTPTGADPMREAYRGKMMVGLALWLAEGDGCDWTI